MLIDQTEMDGAALIESKVVQAARQYSDGYATGKRRTINGSLSLTTPMMSNGESRRLSSKGNEGALSLQVVVMQVRCLSTEVVSS
jgi:hypothetical protein